jgi:hypothetical protein
MRFDRHFAMEVPMKKLVMIALLVAASAGMAMGVTKNQEEASATGSAAANAAATPGAKYSPQGSTDPAAPEIKAAAAPVRTAKMELFYPGQDGFRWNLEVQFKPNTAQGQIVGGTLTGTICGPGNWKITGGQLSDQVIIHAERVGPATNCARTVTIVAAQAGPDRYNGRYGFDGSATDFHHTMVFGGIAP